MRLNKTYLVFLLVCLFVVLSQTDAVAQCAMCKASAESNLKNNPNSIARGLNSGILYLMAVPYLAIAFIFRKQIYSIWKKLRGKEDNSTVGQ